MPDAPLTLDEVKAEVKRIDPTLSEDHRFYKTAVFLVAALKAVRPERRGAAQVHRLLARLAHPPHQEPQARGHLEGRPVHHRWYDDGFGAVELRLDIKTAEGEMDEDVDSDTERKARSTLAEVDADDARD